MDKTTRLAIYALVLARKKWAFDANLRDRGILTPHTVKAAKKVGEINAAIAELQSRAGVVAETENQFHPVLEED